MLVKLGVRSKMTLSLSYFLCPCWRDENWMNTVAHHEQHCSCLFSSCLGPLSPPPTWSTAGKSWTWHSWPTYSITIQPLMNPILKKCCQRSKKREKKKVKKKRFWKCLHRGTTANVFIPQCIAIGWTHWEWVPMWTIFTEISTTDSSCSRSMISFNQASSVGRGLSSTSYCLKENLNHRLWIIS